ncbi:MAG: TIGR02452 family protein [Deltaproteobacteria bacterium]|nr:TIGR02452 family protein [Deltaproteobacteria bacterium]
MPPRLDHDERREIARTTLEACDAGFYVNARGERVELAASLAHASSGTVLHEREGTPVASSKRSSATAPPGRTMRVSVTGESTLEALVRLDATGEGHVACLNFASARKPGGGFLGGAQAQEESLARASGLYPCLQRVPSHYERNRAQDSALYLDLAIFSPRVPFFRDDGGAWLERPVLASVVTCAAPNAGALRQHGRFDAAEVEATLARRAALVLDVALHHGVERLVLGAWGAGVFGNDPVVVADVFARLLVVPEAPYAHAFDELVFAVLDGTRDRATHRAFEDAFG